ncbi:MAG: 30S ribosome-binding factor RbfA, partial [bacterium]
MTRRTEKLQEFIKEQVSEIIQQHVRDPRIGFVSITDVEVSADMRHAKIFVSVLGDEDAKSGTMAGLDSALKFIRGELGRRLEMRYTPEIMFKL